jgi:IrrE N-terminal-like domain
MSLVDYKGPYRSEAFIAEAAMICWNLGTPPGTKRVDLNVILRELQAHGVESIFQTRGIKRKGRLKIEMPDDDPTESPASVEFTPRLLMRVQESVWSRFQEGRNDERVVIAHEIGHVMLHSDDPKQFSRDAGLQITFAEQEYSVEWQANRFADHLLIPTRIAESVFDVARLAFVCNVSERFAFERLSNVCKEKKMCGSVPNGRLCPDCGRFSIPDGDTQCECKNGW